MSINGVRQLRKLVINYNTTAGGSAGLRDYMSQHLYSFAAANPDIDIIAKPIYLRGTATVTASWMNGRRETLPLANLDATEISQKLRKLRNRTGVDERERRFVTQRSKFPSVQGKWTESMNMKNDLTKPDLVINGKPNTLPPNPLDMEITLLTEGLPDPKTKKDWVEMGEDNMKHLAQHKVQREARKKAEAAEAEWAKKNPELAVEKEKKMLIEMKANAAKQAAAEEAEKKKLKPAAAAAPKGKK
jgi:hypothetical protein